MKEHPSFVDMLELALKLFKLPILHYPKCCFICEVIVEIFETINFASMPVLWCDLQCSSHRLLSSAFQTVLFTRFFKYLKVQLYSYCRRRRELSLFFQNILPHIFFKTCSVDCYSWGFNCSDGQSCFLFFHHTWYHTYVFMRFYVFLSLQQYELAKKRDCDDQNRCASPMYLYNLLILKDGLKFDIQISSRIGLMQRKNIFVFKIRTMGWLLARMYRYSFSDRSFVHLADSWFDWLEWKSVSRSVPLIGFSGFCILHRW